MILKNSTSKYFSKITFLNGGAKNTRDLLGLEGYLVHSFLWLLWNGSRGPENRSLRYILAKLSANDSKVQGILYLSYYQSENSSPKPVSLLLNGRESSTLAIPQFTGE